MWQSLLRNWVWGAVTSAAKDAATGSSQTTAAPTTRPCEVGLIFALPQESVRLTDRMSGTVTTHGAGFVAVRGMLADKSLAVIISGAGRDAAHRATDAMITAYRPRWILSTGFAGGLHDDLKHGDFLFGNEVVTPTGQSLSIDLKMDPGQLERSRNLHVGRLVTADKVITTPAAKRALQQQSGALAVDMETFAVAQACQALETPLLSVRIISDAVDEALPKDIGKLITKPTRTRQVGYALGTLLRRPSSAKDLWALRTTAADLSERLAKLLVGVIEQLPARKT